MRTISILICAIALVATEAHAEYEVFRLDLSTYPLGKLSVQPDYTSDKQTMYLNGVTISTLPDGVHKFALMAGGGSSFLNFFVSKPTYITDKVITATWSGRWFGNDATYFSLAGSHFQGIAGIKFDNRKLYLTTDAGIKEIGQVTLGATYRAFLTVSYESGGKTPTARLRYIEQTTPTQSKAYGPISVKFTTTYDALSENYITFLTSGENAVAALNSLTISTGSQPLKLPTGKQLPPQKLPLMQVTRVPFKQ